MPRGNGTGPLGMGPMTGRGLGYCTGIPAPGYMNPATGRGFFGPRRGQGGGRGFRCRTWAQPGWIPYGFQYGRPEWGPQGYSADPYQPTVNREKEIETLKSEAQELEKALKVINKRLADLTKE